MHGPSRAIEKAAWVKMSDTKNDTDAGQSVDSSQAHNAADNGHSSNGNGSGDTTKYFTAPLPTVDGATSEQSNGNGHPKSSNGNSPENGHAAPTQTVRPVKARVGNGHDGITNYEPRISNGHGNYDTAPNIYADGDAAKARVSPDTAEIPALTNTTSRLRDGDLVELRLRLKAEEWPLVGTERSRRGKRRALPYFMMRHRNMRSRSRVGYVRSQAAARKYGNGGPTSIIAVVLVVTFVLGFLTSAAGMGAGLGGAAYYVSKLPPVDPEHLAENIALNGISTQTTKIYDRNGTLLYDFVDEDTGRREELPLDQVSPLVISATIAAEDANFYSNPGVDPFAILRAVVINVRGEGSSGASTITQQLARNIFMSEEERTSLSPDRKIKEAVLALEMTQKYSKDDILALYLNQIPYGHRAYGIGA